MLNGPTHKTFAEKKFIIIGAGIAGATAATTLEKFGVDKENIIILEKNNRIGGKLKTFRIGDNIHIDMGAVILSPLSPALDFIAQHHLKINSIFPQNQSSMNQIFYEQQPLSFGQKTEFWWQYSYQVIKFMWFNSDLTKTYGELQQTIQLNLLTKMLKVFVPAMGYGAVEDMTLAKLRQYVDSFLLVGPLLKYNPGKILARVQKGYQQIPEKMLTEFNVKTGVKITKIQRSSEKTTIFFHDKRGDDSLQEVIEADYLILAISPFYWSNLGMKLTTTEQACIDTLRYYRYPVAVCKIKNLPAEQIFVPEALEKSGFNHVALIVPQSEMIDGWRYAVVYINLPACTHYEDNFANIRHDLYNLGFDEVEIITHKTWKDYSAIIDLSCLKKLEHEQGQLNTFYLGGFMRFDNVSCTIKHVQDTLGQYFGKLPNCFENIKIYPNRIKTFFSSARANDVELKMNANPNANNENDRLLVEIPRLR